MIGFPEDFMFELTNKEFENLRCNLDIKLGWQAKYLPLLLPSKVYLCCPGYLISAVAIQVHIQIIRIFTKMRELFLTNKDILLKLEKMEKDVKENKEDIAIIFKALKQLLKQPKPKRNMIGFKPDE